jgi:hypothetical protein
MWHCSPVLADPGSATPRLEAATVRATSSVNAGIVKRGRRTRLLTGRHFFVSSERKSVVHRLAARRRNPNDSVRGDRGRGDETGEPPDHAEHRPALIAHPTAD